VENLRDLADDEVIRLYKLWSEETYCAGFLSPSADSVGEFIHWLRADGHVALEEPVQDYELEMVALFREMISWERLPPPPKRDIAAGIEYLQSLTRRRTAGPGPGSSELPCPGQSG